MSGERGPWYLMLRVLLWGGVAVVVLALVLRRGTDQLREHPPLTQQTVPHAMVGVWTSTRGATMRCIELREDGFYNMVPNTAAGDRFGAATGTWRVVGQSITWRDDGQGGAVDINRMIDVTDTRFTAIEADGTRTRFELIAPTATARCPR